MVSRDGRYTETRFFSLCCGCIKKVGVFRWQIINSYWKRRIKTTHTDDFCSSIRKSPTVALIWFASVCRDICTVYTAHKLSKVFKILFKRKLTVRSSLSIFPRVSRFCNFHRKWADLRLDLIDRLWADLTGSTESKSFYPLRVANFDGSWIPQNAERRDGNSFSIYLSFIDFHITIPFS